MSYGDDEGPASAWYRGNRAFTVVTAVVEMGGIEPPSIAFELRLLRAQSVKTFCSAPTFSTDTQVDGPSLERVPRDIQTPSRSKIPK